MALGEPYRAREALLSYQAFLLSSSPPFPCGLKEAADISEIWSGVLGSSLQTGRGGGKGGGKEKKYSLSKINSKAAWVS